MAIDPQALFDESKCYSCLGLSAAEALELALLARIAAGVGPVPVAPAVPLNIDISDASVAGNTIVTWTNSDVPTTNEIWKSTDAGATYNLYATVAGNIASYTDAAAMVVQTYWLYKVRACNGAACSAFTDPRGVSYQYAPTSLSLPYLVLAYDYLNYQGTALAGAASFPLLRSVGDYLALQNAASITSISLPVLKSVGNYVAASSDPALVSFSAPLLQTIASALELSTNPALTALNLDSLQTVGDDFFFNSTGLTTLSFPALTSITQTWNWASNASLTSVSAPLLQNIGGSFLGSGSTQTTITLPALQNVGSDITLNACVHVTSLSLPALTAIGGDLNMQGCSALATIALPLLATMGGGLAGNMECNLNPLLTSLSIPNLLWDDNAQDIHFQSCALVVGNDVAGTGIDGILHRAVASALSMSDIALDLGTNATPDATGQINKGILIGNGCTVTTN